MNMMMNARFLDTNERIFKIRIFQRLCNSCRARGNMSCKHRVEVAWSNQRQSRKIAGLMKQHEHDFRTEILNEEVESTINRVFPSHLADPFIQSQYRFPPGAEIKHIFIGIDPSGGGTQSKFAIVSIAFVERILPAKRMRGNGSSDVGHDANRNASGDHRYVYDTVVRPPLPPSLYLYHYYYYVANSGGTTSRMRENIAELADRTSRRVSSSAAPNNPSLGCCGMLPVPLAIWRDHLHCSHVQCIVSPVST